MLWSTDFFSLILHCIIAKCPLWVFIAIVIGKMSKEIKYKIKLVYNIL